MEIVGEDGGERDLEGLLGGFWTSPNKPFNSRIKRYFFFEGRKDILRCFCGEKLAGYFYIGKNKKNNLNLKNEIERKSRQ